MSRWSWIRNSGGVECNLFWEYCHGSDDLDGTPRDPAAARGTFLEALLAALRAAHLRRQLGGAARVAPGLAAGRGGAGGPVGAGERYAAAAGGVDRYRVGGRSE